MGDTVIVKLETEIGKYISLAKLSAYNDDGTPYMHKGIHYVREYSRETEKCSMPQKELDILLMGCRHLNGKGFRIVIKAAGPYMANCLMNLRKWQQSEWKTAKGKHIKHRERWQEVYEILKDYEVEVKDETVDGKE